VVKPLGFQEFVSVLKEMKRFWLWVNELPPVEFANSEGASSQRTSPQPACAF
jgi:hypothetical protein